MEANALQQKSIPVSVYEMNLETLNRTCEYLSAQINHSGFSPDIIVSIMAMDPAQRLQKFFPLHIPISRIWIRRTVDTSIAAEKRPPYVYNIDPQMEEKIKGKRVLLVDDVVKYGETMKKAIQILSEMKPEEIQTASLLTSTTSVSQIQHKGVLIQLEDWIIFPWKKNRPREIN